MIEKLAIALAIIIGTFGLYLMFAIVPVAFYADATCLRNGYPKAHVTIGLETYCSNLQGTVTVKVEKLK